MKTTKPRDLLDEVEAILGTRKRFLTTGEFAQITGMHRQTVWEACARGDLPAHQNGKNGHYRIRYTQLNDFFQEAA